MFERVVTSLHEVRAGQLGVIRLGPAAPLRPADPLTRASCEWESCSDYAATRHGRRGEPTAAVIAADVALECARRGFPTPEVEVLSAFSGPRGGAPTGRLRLSFKVAVRGPLMLGRTGHLGGGLFRARGG